MSPIDKRAQPTTTNILTNIVTPYLFLYGFVLFTGQYAQEVGANDQKPEIRMPARERDVMTAMRVPNMVIEMTYLPRGHQILKSISFFGLSK